MVAPIGILGLALISVRLVLLGLTGPEHPWWVDQTLRLEWWLLQPATWAASVKQALDLHADAQALRQRAEAAEAAITRIQRGKCVTGALASGSALLAGAGSALWLRASTMRSTQRPCQLPVEAIAELAAPSPPSVPLPPQATVPARWVVGGFVALAFAGARRRSSRQFQDHVHKEFVPDRQIRRTVVIQCPGVLRGNVVINLHPNLNGAEVSLARGATRGVSAAAWKKAYHFPWREGTYKCRQEALVLETGVLTLVFEADMQERFLFVPAPAPALAYSIAGGDTPPLREEQQSDLEGCDIATSAGEQGAP